MPLQDPQGREKTLEALQTQPFARHLGVEGADAGDGWFEVRLPIASHLTQHDGVVHGGVIATLADTCAALAAHTLAAPGEQVLTVEFKISYLRPARLGVLRGRGTVLRRGRTLTTSEAEVFAEGPEGSVLVAKALATIALVPERR